MEMHCFLSFPLIAALANPPQQRERTPESIHNSVHSIHNPTQQKVFTFLFTVFTSLLNRKYSQFSWTRIAVFCNIQHNTFSNFWLMATNSQDFAWARKPIFWDLTVFPPSKGLNFGWNSWVDSCLEKLLLIFRDLTCFPPSKELNFR